MADEGYSIIQKALKDTGKIGVGQFILRGRGNIVAIKPFGKGLLLEVLRHANEIRAAEPLFKEITEVKVDKEALDLAKELIKRKTGKFEPEQLKDEYNEAVWELINAKLEDRAPEIVTEMPGSAKVINIMDALKRSVSAGQGRWPPKRRRSAARHRPRRNRQEGGEGRAQAEVGLSHGARRSRGAGGRDLLADLQGEARFRQDARAQGQASSPRAATASSSRSTPRAAPISISGSSMTGC